MPRNNSCEDCPREILEKVWLKKNHNCGRSRVLKFSLPYGLMFLMLMKTKKKSLKFKNLKNGKNALEIWWTASF